MMKNKQNARIIGMLLGMAVGLGIGIALDNIAVGLAIGVPYGITFGKKLAGEHTIKDKKTRRIVSGATYAILVLGCIGYGAIVGEFIGGVACAIGFSFVVGLKWDELYDERMSSMFSKAARNAFVVINLGFSTTVFLGEVMGFTLLESVSLIEQIKYVVYLSWGVFLLSWVYHAYIKGE
jgi:hypothetical protein